MTDEILLIRLSTFSDEIKKYYFFENDLFHLRILSIYEVDSDVAYTTNCRCDIYREKDSLESDSLGEPYKRFSTIADIECTLPINISWLILPKTYVLKITPDRKSPEDIMIIASPINIDRMLFD